MSDGQNGRKINGLKKALEKLKKQKSPRGAHLLLANAG
jgi:hypothetical protein